MLVKYALLSAVALTLQFLLAGCATNTAPRGWLFDVEETEKKAFGAWISVEYHDSLSGIRVDGEFIAVGEDKIYVLTQQDLIPIDRGDIEKATITAYNSKAGLIGVWTLLGSLSTGSHGGFLLISLPAWVLVGSIASASQSHAPVSIYPSTSWENLRGYARFPRGLPRNFQPRRTAQ